MPNLRKEYLNRQVQSSQQQVLQLRHQLNVNQTTVSNQCPHAVQVPQGQAQAPIRHLTGTECSLVPTGLPEITHSHVPNSACFYLVCDHDPIPNRLECYIGEKLSVDMLIEMNKKSDKCI